MMKYIILKTGEVIMFSEAIRHIQIANFFGGRDVVVSAGFFSCAPETVDCGGESGTLQLSALEGDNEIVAEEVKE